MSADEVITATNSVTYQGPATAAPAVAAAGSSDLTFGEVLSDLNPLQYLPVVGTIYRAITGDVIPKPLREAGSLVVSGLMGGPVGVATNLAMLAFEKLTGIDLEDVEQKVLAYLTPGKATEAPTTQTATATPASDATSAVADAPVADSTPWTTKQLAAYGVVTRADGNLQQGNLTGADVLNALQLRSTAGLLLAA